MAFKSLAPPASFSIFAPKTPALRGPTEIRFSRWNNANAQKFVQEERSQKEIEDEIRRERRFRAATIIAEDHEPTIAEGSRPPEFKSAGTPSVPSRSSIPGRRSKYSKHPESADSPHPAFRRRRKVPAKFLDAANAAPSSDDGVGPSISVGERGVSYRLPDAPFEFQYSYTEAPRVKPLALREPPVSPFGPTTMPRPWTGRKPLPPSKKKLPEFDSFRLPPPHKKGVKSVQAPGPFLAGSGPKYVRSREEILGEPLTEEEIKDLVQGCLKTRRQLNMGRDGLTHNMLDNIHAHWKRRRVCKIKCKGVCTVDMDNVRQQLEEKTGGRIIYSKGGVVFLFRGRNYNYKTRPRFPLMLWKPVTPVYPRLIKRAPEGLTLEEAGAMRKRGRLLPPICKLGKNGVYGDLVKNVQEAFEECDLVRINCQGMNTSDYKKIGAKLQDLIPCVLISFEHEHILMWRGRGWKSSFQTVEGNRNETTESISESKASNSLDIAGPLPLECLETADSNVTIEALKASTDEEDKLKEIVGGTNSTQIPEASHESPSGKCMIEQSTTLDNSEVIDEITTTSEHPWAESSQTTSSSESCKEGLLLLLKQALENGQALALDEDEALDGDVVYEKAVAFAKTAPPGPAFRQTIRKVVLKKLANGEGKQNESGDLAGQVATLQKNHSRNRSLKKLSRKLLDIDCNDITPQGSLRVDELAKLLA